MMDNDRVYKIDWIDDDFAEDGNGDRNKLVSVLENNNNIKINQILPDYNSLNHWRKQSLPNSRPTIILMDWKFDEKGEEGSSSTLIRSGSELIGWLQKIPEIEGIPKYLVSRVIPKKKGHWQSEDFDRIFTHEEITKDGKTILSDDCRDYDVLLSAVPDNHSQFDADSVAKNVNSLLVNNQEDVIDEDVTLLVLEEINELMRSISSNEVSFHDVHLGKVRLGIARWIRGIFLVKQGPLVDDQMVAILLGTSEDYFEQHIANEIIQDMPDAIYNGLFSNSLKERRWWRHKVIFWAMSKYPDLAVSSIARFAEGFSAAHTIPEAEQSVCTVCRQNWPDALACDESDQDEIRPVHLHCSRIDKYSTYHAGFDETRFFQTVDD